MRGRGGRGRRRKKWKRKSWKRRSRQMKRNGRRKRIEGVSKKRQRMEKGGSKEEDEREDVEKL